MLVEQVAKAYAQQRATQLSWLWEQVMLKQMSPMG
jgi:hypothetical protein